MAIQKLNDDLNIIAKLGDNPRTDDGLSTQGFKAKFDEAAVRIKNYINNVLIPGIEGSVSEDGLLSQIASALGQKLDLAGGTMTGAVNMNGKRLYNVPAPQSDGDAVNKNYSDSNLAAAKDYTDSKHFFFDATLSTGWEGVVLGGSEVAPYTQVVTLEGILATDRPHVTPAYTPSETAILEKEAWSMVSYAVTSDGSITFICFEDKPTTAINVEIEVNR